MKREALEARIAARAAKYAAEMKTAEEAIERRIEEETVREAVRSFAQARDKTLLGLLCADEAIRQAAAKSMLMLSAEEHVSRDIILGDLDPDVARLLERVPMHKRFYIDGQGRKGRQADNFADALAIAQKRQAKHGGLVTIRTWTVVAEVGTARVVKVPPYATQIEDGQATTAPPYSEEEER